MNNVDVAKLLTGEIGRYEGLSIHTMFYPAPWAVEAAAMLMPHYRAVLERRNNAVLFSY